MYLFCIKIIHNIWPIVHFLLQLYPGNAGFRCTFVEDTRVYIYTHDSIPSSTLELFSVCGHLCYYVQKQRPFDGLTQILII